MDQQKKICYVCNLKKDLNKFTIDKKRKSGITNRCKLCTKEYKRLYFINNQDKIKVYRKNYINKNKNNLSNYYKQYNEKRKEEQKIYLKDYRKLNKTKAKEYSKIYREKNKDYLLNQKKDYYENNKKKIQLTIKKKLYSDPIFNLCCKLSSRNRHAFISKNISKSKHFYEYIGCTGKELYDYIESKFTKRMSWEKILSAEIEIDHIVELANATTEEEVYTLNHYTNLQPLWKKDHLEKSNNFKRIKNYNIVGIVQ